MTERTMTDHDTTALSTMTAPAATPSTQAPNPMALVQDRLQNRWGWCVLTGLALGALLATGGFYVAPVKYAATAYVKIDAKLDTILAEDMPETKAMDNYDAYVSQQVVLLTDPRVFAAVADAAARGEPTVRAKAERPNEAAEEAAAVRKFFAAQGADQGLQALADGLVVTTPRSGSMLEVRFESPDKAIPAPVANWIVDAYLDIYGPSAETVYSRKIASLREMMTLARRDETKFAEERIAVLKDTPYGSADLASLIEARVTKMRELEEKLATNKSLQQDIERQWDLAKAKEGARPAVAAESAATPPDELRLEPTLAELDAIDPSLPGLRRAVDAAKIRFSALPKTYKPEHRVYEMATREVNSLEAQLAAARAGAYTMWSEGHGRDLNLGAARRQAIRLSTEHQALRTEIDQANMLLARLTETDRRIEESRKSEQSFAVRIGELEREQDSIRRGRLSVARYASQLPTPASDKRVQFASLGLLGGLGASFGLFFLIGTISPRAFRASQLANDAHGLQWLGVIPDMSQAASDPFAHDLAINCVDRLRNKIESRRAPGEGYAMLVTSPAQGDGKTTVALSLAISYARAGHRPVIVDCDFIGRAMSGMLDRLHAPGVREVLRRGELGDELVEAQPGVWLLPIGTDPNVSASHVQVGAMRRLLRTLRDRFDIIIVDAGPMTASVEAIPVAASCDGAMLVIRRGRSRGRLAESIAEIRSAGSDYIGLVLNDAVKSDCMRYGSISKMSTDVASALDGNGTVKHRHPLLGVGRVMHAADATPRRGAA